MAPLDARRGTTLTALADRQSQISNVRGSLAIFISSRPAGGCRSRVPASPHPRQQYTRICPSARPRHDDRRASPGADGRLFTCGTASRLVLCERHSHRWFVNFLPPAINRLLGHDFQRDLAPWTLTAALSGRFEKAVNPGSWLRARRAIHGSAGLPFRAYAMFGRLTGRSPGWSMPFIELLLCKA